jgi:hypothetical protein
MLLPIAIVILPVALGVALGLIPQLHPQAAKHTRVLFLIAAVVVALVQLLPEAYEELGGLAALAFILAFATPAILEQLTRGAGLNIGLGLALIGFLIHQLFDGVQIGFAAAAQIELLSLGTALAMHTTPLTAVITEKFAKAHGLRVAASISLIIMAITAAGVIAGNQVAIVLPEINGWLQAIIAGLLLHILWHSSRSPDVLDVRQNASD